MKNIIGVRFRSAGKIYWFSPGAHELKRGDAVIVETSRGKEFGTVVVPPKEVDDDKTTQPLKEIVRPANRIDIEQEIANREKEKDAFNTCKERIIAKGLEMKLIQAEYTWDNSKILFYFTADGRVDFRELVRELAAIFKTRIELRQIGVRDETKMIGGYGICGRDLCCHAYLPDFSPVSIKMAKEQNLSLNPTKISGACGRLLCCLSNEEEAYEEINKRMPNVGDEATAPDGSTGQVISVNVLRETARIVVDVGDEREVREYAAAELDFVKSTHKRRKKPKIEITRKPEQKEAREQAIKNAKEQAIAAAIERQNQEKEEDKELFTADHGDEQSKKPKNRRGARDNKHRTDRNQSGQSGRNQEKPRRSEKNEMNAEKERTGSENRQSGERKNYRNRRRNNRRLRDGRPDSAQNTTSKPMEG